MHADVHVSDASGRTHDTPRAGLLDLRLAADADAPALARQAVGNVLRAWSADRRERALLAVSELVTNAVRHGSEGPQDAVRVRVERRGASTRIEVIDRRALGGTVHAAASAHESGAVAGWGLPIVAELTDRWGVESGSTSTGVWCELNGM